MNLANRALAECAVAAIRAYQLFVSPIVGGRARCRFFPSCSDYAIEVLRRFGVVLGGRLALARILRCNPMGGHGFDPAPLKPAGRNSLAGKL